MTMYQAIKKAKESGCWQPLLRKQSMRTLDRYYDVYELVMKYEPERRYGYVNRLLTRKDFASLIPKDKYGAFRWDNSTIKWIIHEMEC